LFKKSLIAHIKQNPDERNFIGIFVFQVLQRICKSIGKQKDLMSWAHWDFICSRGIIVGKTKGNPVYFMIIKTKRPNELGPLDFVCSRGIIVGKTKGNPSLLTSSKILTNFSWDFLCVNLL
jgi:hypothetical protein